MIIYFSGNGNTKAVARRMADSIGDSIVELRGRAWPLHFDIDRQRAIWALPVHSWGIPAVVEDYIRGLAPETFPTGTVHHLVLTCGDDTGNAPERWARLVRAHGWTVGSTFSVQMPNTYTLLPGFDVDSPELALSKLEAMPSRIDTICGEIGKCPSGRVDDVVRGSLPWLKSNVVFPLFRRYDIKPSLFRASDDCISCGRCARACPLDNIRLDKNDGKPRWGEACTQCLGCYNTCPTGAVSYGRRTRGKGRFYQE